MPEEPSKYAGNQFDTATEGRLPLMAELLATTLPRITAKALLFPALAPAQAAITTANNNWNGGETILANAEAAQIGATFALDDKLASVTRKPDADTNSPLETWDVAIRGQVAYQGPTYLLLLPQGRETLTVGPIEQRLDALRDFGIRLSNQATKPVLVSLGTTVTTFANAARGLRNAQLAAMTAVGNARGTQETLRKAAAVELYAMVGLAMTVWKTTPDQVDTLFEVGLLRGPAQAVPAAPATTLWNPGTRTLSTTALPEGASRLEAWREGPGGAPELLAVGEKEALEVVIPANFTFDAGDLYQLWLQARNSQGSSGPGPKQSWTAS